MLLVYELQFPRGSSGNGTRIVHGSCQRPTVPANNSSNRVKDTAKGTILRMNVLAEMKIENIVIISKFIEKGFDLLLHNAATVQNRR